MTAGSSLSAPIFKEREEDIVGKIVHTTDSIGRRGVAQGEICRTCPGGCKTDCLRAGVRVEQTRHVGGYDFSISFAEIDDSDLTDPYDEY